MGFLIALGIEIARAIKKKKENKTMSAEQIFVRDNPFKVKYKESFLIHIDIFIKSKDPKWLVKQSIDEYINYHSKDNEILKRIELMNKMEDE